jgi:hypothetical protein
MIDHLPLPAVGATDSFTLTVTAFREPTLTAQSFSEFQTYPAGGAPQDFRVGGKGVMLKMTGTAVKTVFRFGDIDVASVQGGQR